MANSSLLNSKNGVKRKTYRSFSGVDLTSAVTEVSDRRSPDAPNMIADESGFPQKRTGTKPLASFGERINGIHYFKSEGKFIVHSGSNLYLTKLDGSESALLYSDCRNSRSASFTEGGCLYILDGGRYLKYSGGEIKAVDERAYIPTTQISAPPEGGGQAFEPINLLSDYRINSFLGKAGTLVYQLDASDIDGIVKCEVKNARGEWEPVYAYSCDNKTGAVTFASAPGAPAVSGEDNVRITFKRAVPEYKKRINCCEIYARYGMGSDTRLFVSGSAERKNCDYYSASGNCEYFPDVNYSVIGTDETAVMGYLHQYDSLVIIKEKCGRDPAIYFRKAAEEGGKTVFSVMPALSGAGAVSKYCFADVSDDNVFLSEQGLMGLSCSSVTLQRTVQNRSGYINRAFTKEIGLAGAYGCAAGAYYFIFINNRAYIADLRQKSDNRAGSYGYEWFCFTDVPARCALYEKGRLYLGTDGGEVRVFRDELAEGMEAYNDVLADGTSVPVKCRWTTKADALSDSAVYKKICKSGTGVVIKPFANTGGTICYIADYEQTAADFSLSTVFDFNDVDFNDFGFGAPSSPYFVPARRKKRKAKMWSMVIKNEEPSSAFGIYEIRVNFKDGSYIKR